MRTVYSRNIFVDSEVGTTQRGSDTKVTFPANEFSIRGRQLMRLTLSSFEMRKNFYNIASNINNVFYLFDGVATYTPIIIPPKLYNNPADIATEIDTIVAGLYAGSTCTHDAATRKYTITLGGTAPAGAYFVSFQVKNNTPAPPPGVNPDHYFVDTHEIMGGRPTRDDWTPPTGQKKLLDGTGPGAHVSPYVSSLNSLEALYLTCTLPTNNYQSVNFERNTPIAQQELIPTQILARIPLSRQFYTDEYPFITFEDPNNLFGLLMDIQQLGTVTFSLQDDKGRDIWQVAPQQAQDGLLSYKFSLKWEVVEMETPDHAFRTPEPPLKSQKVQQPFQ